MQQNHNAGNMTNTRNTDIKKAKKKTSDHQLLHVVKDYDLIQCLNLIDCNNFDWSNEKWLKLSVWCHGFVLDKPGLVGSRSQRWRVKRGAEIIINR